MKKRGVYFVYLALFSILTLILISKFISAACTGTLSCSLINSYPEEERAILCSKIYGAWCSFSISTATCSNRAGVSCATPSMSESVCDGTVGCTWVSDPRCVDSDGGTYNQVQYIDRPGFVTFDGGIKGYDTCMENYPVPGRWGVNEQYCPNADSYNNAARECGVGSICKWGPCIGNEGTSCGYCCTLPTCGTRECGTVTNACGSVTCGSYSGGCPSGETCNTVTGVCETNCIATGGTGCIGVGNANNLCCSGVCIAGTCRASCDSSGAFCSTTSTNYNSYGICASSTCDTSGAARISSTYYSSCSGLADNTVADTNSLAGGFVSNGYCCGGAFSSSSCCTVSSYTPALNTFCNSRTVTDNCGGTSTQTGTLTCTYPQTCINNQCVCTPTKTSCDSDDCESVPNGCGVYLSCGGCSGGEQCVSNTCQCVSSSDVTCYNDDVYRVDSCGNTITTSKVEECNKGNSCYDYYCSGGACRADYTCGCNGDNSKCADTDLCTIDTCASDGTCDYTYRTCGVDGDGCCRSGCTYPNDQDCPPPVATCGDGSINQAWEECDCGTDGICSSSELGGETCSSWDSKYTGGTLGCSSCQIITTMCTEPCSLEDAYWSTSSTYVGSSVDLIVTGSSSCTGKLITFEVWKDGTLSDTRVTTLSSKTMSSGNVINTWTPTETSPNNGYYFIAKISDGSDSIKSDALEVLENVGCGDGTCGSGENCNNCPDDCKSCCGNGMCDSNECVTCPGDCSNCEIPCGNGKCETVLGENCNTCAADCPLCPPQNCGNGNIDSGEVCDGANLGGETCISQGYGGGSLVCAWNCQSFDVGGCTGEPPKECEINSPTWNVTTALEGTPVRLNFNAVNCNGETISFFVLEKDGGLLNRDEPAKINPASFVYGPSNTYGTWYAEGQDDDDETGGESYPPEYYFRVIVNDEKKAESSNSGVNDPLLLKVQSPDITCAGINYCADYDNQEDCENDAALCNVGEASVFGVSCGSVYNDVTQCWDKVTCGCSWNNDEGVCKGEWGEESECGENNVCVPYESECWLAGDLCTDECTCFGTSTPNGEGSCDYSGSDVCSEEDQCWLAGDHCEDDCTCEDGYPSNNDGTCGDYNPNVCVEDYNENECWLAGDLCTDECTCFGTSTPNGEGSCDYSGSDVCSEEDQCWLAGDHCEDDCTCEDGYETNNNGICVDENGGSGGIIRKKGTCLYTETGGDTCEDNYLDRVLDAVWQWDPTNSYTEIPAGENEADYVQDVENGVYRYDPQRKSQLCIDIQDRFVCPASVEVPFFGMYQLITALTIVGLIYLIFILRKKE